ncbi:MAG: DUF1109 family protein [Bradyrhizobium sp.]|uniref:NrsF family protein n=1 Tax=Bradyrhizobium sp. TaxID=376 RepID=UPI001A196899|nr:NrsF family protein [Bradyrhizobium sp.]MBJ7401900.1 DUF1109 family protein [Bradyrhizobium sp.]
MLITAEALTRLPSAIFLYRLRQPKGRPKTSTLLLLAPLLTISLIALIGIVAGEKFHWSEVVLSGDWVECVISIPVIEIVPFAMTFWAMRRSMPGNLKRAGAIAGHASGTLCVFGYAVHCSSATTS